MIHIGVLQFCIEIPYAASLKDKRRVVKSLKDRIRRSHNVSVAEIDDLDEWTIATMSAVMVGNDVAYINSALDKLLARIGDNREARLGAHQLEIMTPP